MTRWIVNHTPFRHGEADLVPGMEYDGPALAHLIDSALIVDAESDRGKFLIERLALIQAGGSPEPTMRIDAFDAATGIVGDQDNPGTSPEAEQSNQSANIEEVINRLNNAGLDVEVIDDPNGTDSGSPGDAALDGHVVGHIGGGLSAETLALLDEAETDEGAGGNSTDDGATDLTTDLPPVTDLVPASIKHVPGTSTWRVMRGEDVVDGPMPKADAEAKVAELNAAAGA